MIKTKLIIDEKEINVLYYNFELKRTSDETGLPTEITVFDRLKLIIEARKDLDLDVWAHTANQTKQLVLHISPATMG